MALQLLVIFYSYGQGPILFSSGEDDEDEEEENEEREEENDAVDEMEGIGDDENYAWDEVYGIGEVQNNAVDEMEGIGEPNMDTSEEQASLDVSSYHLDTLFEEPRIITFRRLGVRFIVFSSL